MYEKSDDELGNHPGLEKFRFDGKTHILELKWNFLFRQELMEMLTMDISF